VAAAVTTVAAAAAAAGDEDLKLLAAKNTGHLRFETSQATRDDGLKSYYSCCHFVPFKQ